MAAAILSPLQRGSKDDVFNFIFPKANYTTPTPEATPSIGVISSPVLSSKGFNASHNAADDTIEFNRAWSAVTRYLSLPPGSSITTSSVDRDVIQAFSCILSSPSTISELVAWYKNEINLGFTHFVKPSLQAWDAPISTTDASSVLYSTVEVLQQAQSLYLSRIWNLSVHFKDASTIHNLRLFANRIRQCLHTIGLFSLPKQRVQSIITAVIFEQLQKSLQDSGNPERCLKDGDCHCSVRINFELLIRIESVGLGGSMGERALAQAVHKFLQGPAIERRCLQVDWIDRNSVMHKLRSWIETALAPVIENAVMALTGTEEESLPPKDVEQLVSMAVVNMGRLRTLALFDYVKSWPASTGAILDIREYLGAGGQADKLHVCQSFSDQVQSRLLHAGASTSEILSIYINVIHAFKTLDSRGVLLEKVAIPIRNYLRNREDTVNVIAASFLADVSTTDNIKQTDLDKTCPGIAVEVANSALQESRDDTLLNWDDMEWMPDPIDAGPNYKSSKSEDPVAYILGLFDQEDFIKEIIHVLAQSLLGNRDPEYVKETRLVELLKSRLDATKLQAAEVMLQDVRDSINLGKRINPQAAYGSTPLSMPTPREVQAAIPEEGITLAALYQQFETRMKRTQFVAAVKLVAVKRNDLFFAKRTRVPLDLGHSSKKKREIETNFKTQILSSFFWPQLRSNDFNLPEQLDIYHSTFEEKFNALGSQRKLHFRPALGRVSVKLALEDRTIEEHAVPAWRASVIDTFGSSVAEGEVNDPKTLTVEQITAATTMEEELVQDALQFWIGKKVLYQKEEGVYAVLEHLDMDIIPIQPQIRPEESVSAIVSQDAMLKENAGTFSIVIANMLRNQGPKEIGGMMGITGLLTMFVPTFTYGDEEVAWLLGEMEKRGEVVRNGDVWAVV